MKYIISLIILALGFSTISSAQVDSLSNSKRVQKVTLVSKKGINILPEKGEIAIGIDAVPILYYIGGIFSNNHASTPEFTYGSDFGGLAGIYVKYMLESDLAVRANFRFDFGSITDIYNVAKSTLAYDPNAPEFVEDLVTTKSNAIHIAIGLEKMRGKSRIQGKYGASVIFGYNKYTNSYNYGNSITNEFNTPETYNNTYVNGGRVIKDYFDKGLYLGVRGHLGIEIFIAPKLSIGGEFGYSFIYRWAQNRTTEYQYWNSSEQTVSTVITKTNSNGIDDIVFGIDRLDGAINMFFYF